MESTYTKAASKSDIAIGSMKMVKLGERELLIANVSGSCYAIGNKCTHAGADLSKGTLQGSIVECRRHHAKFDVTTGKVVSPPKMAFLHPKIQDASSYQVNVQNEDIMVKL